MMTKNGLIPRPIVDKNGKHTITYVKPGLNTAEYGFNGNMQTFIEEREPVVDGWDIAGEGETGYGCPFCGVFYTVEQRNWQQHDNYQPCYECGETFDSETANIGVTQESLKFFDDDVVRETEWYHATIKGNWLDGAKRGKNPKPEQEDERYSVLVHLGSLEAAMDRIFFVNEEVGGKDSTLEWTIHKVKLNPDIPIHAAVIDDDSFEPENIYQASKNPDYNSEGVTRYVNRFEHEGAISLAVNPNRITVTETFTMKSDGSFDGLEEAVIKRNHKPLTKPMGY